MDGRTGDGRAEIRALRTDLAQLDQNLNHDNDGQQQIKHRLRRKPRRYKVRTNSLRIRQGLMLLATAGIGTSGILAVQSWQGRVSSVVSQPQPRENTDQKRSLPAPQPQSPSSIDVAELDSLDSIPAPPDKIIQAVQFYLEAGLTPTATAYLVGSLSWESRLDPNAVGDAGQSRGLNQWWVNRRKGMPDSFKGQLEYVLHDMQRDTLSSGTLTTLQTSHDQAEIKAALKRWTRWHKEGKRWDYAETILDVMNHSAELMGSS